MSEAGRGSERDRQLARRMRGLGVREEDLRETFVRSSGHGGQNVNKTSTCVVLVHEPTGLQVRCQASRQQGMNRMKARQLLLDKIEERQRVEAETEAARQAKNRYAKRKRSRGAKERMLADKAQRSRVKEGRRRPDDF